MTPTPDPGDLRGLAREVRQLFDSQATPSAELEAEVAGTDPGDDADVAWVAESPVRLPGDVAVPERLKRWVRTYLKAPSGQERQDARSYLEEAAAEARDLQEFHALADTIELLCTAEMDVQETRALVMDMMGPSVSAILVDRLTDPSTAADRRGRLGTILPELGEEVGMSLIEALRAEASRPDADWSIRRTLLASIAEMAQRRPVLLESMVRDPDWRVVRNGAKIIGEHPDDHAIENLTLALAHAEPRVRREALQSLSKVGGDDAGALALSNLEDPDPSVRAQAARTLGILAVQRALQPLLSRLELEKDPAVSVDVIRALGLLGDPAAVRPLEKRGAGSFFSRSSTEVRVAIYRALAAIGTPHATALLEEALEDNDPEVRTAAEAILQSREL